MARQFNGISDYLQSASAIDLSGSGKVTVAFWLWVNSYTNSNAEVIETSAQWYTTAGSLIVAPDEPSTGSFFCGTDGSSHYGAGELTRPSAAVWHHFVLEFDNSQNPPLAAAYVDGSSVSVGTWGSGGTPGGNFAAAILNIEARNGGSNFLAGRVCQLAFWKGTGLSPTDVTAVFLGTPQSASVSPDYYWTIEGSASPEPAMVGGVALNVHGTTQVADPTATSFSLAGPSSGYVGTASTNFTVTPNGPYTGTVTITPIGGGMSSPIVLTWSSSSVAQTFTITPNAAGIVTLTPTNNGGLMNPSAVSYAAGTAPATSFSLAGPSSGYVGTVSTNFTVTPNGPYTGTVTITPSGGGLSTPIVLTWSASSATQTFAITPTAAGTVTLTPTNIGGLMNPSAVSYAAGTAPATSFSLAGPSSGYVGTASPNFTVTPNGPYTGTVTITPSGDGMSSPIVLTWSSSSVAQTFTITPNAAGIVTLTPTNNGGLMNPSAVSYAVGTAPATSFSLAGPSSGYVGTASPNFTVTPNGPYTGTVTITPSGDGLSSPIVLTWSSSSLAQTFTITPNAAGIVTLTPTNNGGLMNPSAVSYAVGTAPATSFSLAGPSSGYVGTVSTDFTVMPNGPYTGTVTITPIGGGMSSPIVLTWSSSSVAQTFTITPNAAGIVTLTPTNNGGLMNPSAVSYAATAPPATSYILTGPTSGYVGIASTRFAVTPNGPYTGTVTITPSGGGLSSPIVLTWSTSFATQDFTITPNAAGIINLTPTNNGSLMNPSAVTYDASVATYTILPTDLWDNGYSNNVGGNYNFSSTFAKLIYSTDHTTIALGVYCNLYGNYPAWSTCSIRVNGADYQTQACTANGTQTLTFTLPAGTKTVEIIGGGTSDPSGTVLGTWPVDIAFSGGTFATKQTPVTSNRLVVYGDSITIGGNATVLELQGWTNLVRDVRGNGTLLVEAWGYRSLNADAATSGALSSFVSRLAAYEGAAYWLAIGTNDYGLNLWPASSFGTQYAVLLDGLHSAQPTACIFCQTPTVRTVETANGSGDTCDDYRAAIATACTTRNWASLVDGTQILSTFDLEDGVHPTTAGQAKYAAFVNHYLATLTTVAPAKRWIRPMRRR